MTITSAVAPFLKQTYKILPILSRVMDGLAVQRVDLNLALRDYAATRDALQLIDLTGIADPGASHLPDFFADHRAPTIQAAYRANDWDWSCNCRGGHLCDPEVTLLGIAAAPGKLIRVPAAGSDIGNGNQALVLYADAERIPLVYTCNDNVTTGYAIHLEDADLSPSRARGQTSSGDRTPDARCPIANRA